MVRACDGSTLVGWARQPGPRQKYFVWWDGPRRRPSHRLAGGAWPGPANYILFCSRSGWARPGESLNPKTGLVRRDKWHGSEAYKTADLNWPARYFRGTAGRFDRPRHGPVRVLPCLIRRTSIYIDVFGFCAAPLFHISFRLQSSAPIVY